MICFSLILGLLHRPLAWHCGVLNKMNLIWQKLHALAQHFYHQCYTLSMLAVPHILIRSMGYRAFFCALTLWDSLLFEHKKAQTFFISSCICTVYCLCMFFLLCVQCFEKLLLKWKALWIKSKIMYWPLMYKSNLVDTLI